jgi:hypothetical protein
MSMSDVMKEPWSVDGGALLARLVEQHTAQLEPHQCHHPRSQRRVMSSPLEQPSSQPTAQEVALILLAQACYDNKWSTITRHLPGRTDNYIKNHLSSNLSKCKCRVVAMAAASCDHILNLLSCTS